jgi:ribosomal protein L32
MFLGHMSVEGYAAKESDMIRWWGYCALCKEWHFWLKRLIIKVPNSGNAISPHHYCKACRAIIRAKIEPKV